MYIILLIVANCNHSKYVFLYFLYEGGITMINNLGEKLKSARIQNKLSRKVIAERTGVSVSMIGLYESNVRQPSLSILIKLSAIYKVSVDYLLGTDSNTRNVLYLDGLTDKQINVLRMTADCFRNSNT